MQMPPIDVLLNWPKPNYINPEVRGYANIIIIAIFFPIALLTVGIRIYTRLCISKSFGVDDWFNVAALFPTTAFAVISLLAETHYGWNRHIWDVELDTITTGLKVVIGTEILFCLATSLTKISMLALTYRLVNRTSSLLSKVVIGAIILVSAQGIAFIFAVLFQCKNPTNYWTLTFQPQPECISETKLLLGAGVVNMVTDLIAVVLPIPTVWRVKSTIQQQIILVMLFAVGFLITIVGAVRTLYLYRVTSGWDKTWMAFPVWITSSVELYVGIICCSLPATKKFFSRYGPSWLGSPLSSQAPTTLPQSPPKSNSTSVVDEEYNAGIFALDKYGVDKKIVDAHESASRIERCSTEVPYYGTDLERSKTSYSRESAARELYASASQTESKDDLVRKDYIVHIGTPNSST